MTSHVPPIRTGLLAIVTGLALVIMALSLIALAISIRTQPQRSTFASV